MYNKIPGFPSHNHDTYKGEIENTDMCFSNYRKQLKFIIVSYKLKNVSKKENNAF